jgi:modulator of FtsH protease HflK
VKTTGQTQALSTLRVALWGAATQAILAGTLLALGAWSGVHGLSAFGWLGTAGVLLWIWSICLVALGRLHTATVLPKPTSGGTGETGGIESPGGGMTVARRIVGRTMTLLVGAILIWPGVLLWQRASVLQTDWLPRVNGLQGMALMAGWCVVAFGAARFFRLLSRRLPEPSSLNPGRKYLVLCMWGGFLFLAGFAMLHLRNAVLLRMLCRIASLCMLLLGAEVVILAFLGFLRPRRRGEVPRAGFDSLLLSVLLPTVSLRQTFCELVEYQFGFGLTGTSLARFCTRVAWRWVFLFALLSWLLSAAAVIGPAEKGMIVRLGKLKGKPLGAGLHWKVPWPIETVTVEDVCVIRRLHVGSHEPRQPGGDIYLADAPILWSNLHGISQDELIVVAPSADALRMLETHSRPGTTGEHDQSGRPSSVNLLGGDVLVEYRICDLRAWLLAAIDPASLLRQIAERETSRELLRYDIDALLSGGRLQAEEQLLARLRRMAPQLGVEILRVGLSGTHPPMDVAEEFHETIIARQQRKSQIENARSYAARTRIEAVGDCARAETLVVAINRLEDADAAAEAADDGADPHAVTEELLDTAGGAVAEEMAEARGYRWQRENEEWGKAARFRQQVDLYRRGPEIYSRAMYFGTLERGLKAARKYLLLANSDRLVLRLGTTAYPQFLARQPAEGATGRGLAPGTKRSQLGATADGTEPEGIMYLEDYQD